MMHEARTFPLMLLHGSPKDHSCLIPFLHLWHSKVPLQRMTGGNKSRKGVPVDRLMGGDELNEVSEAQ